MTTGDEPMLPQPSDDNAPMIGQRGMYLAGNLPALIESLDTAQQLRFRQTLVRLMASYIRATPDEMVMQDLRDEISRAADLWLSMPSTHIEHSIFVILENYDLVEAGSNNLATGNRELDSGEIGPFGLAATIVADSLREASQCVSFFYAEIQMIGNEQSPRTHEYWQQWDYFVAKLTSWQLEAAWSILQGKEPPPFEMPS